MIWFDMDGTLAKFYEHSDCLEKMYEKGYFMGLNAYKLANFANQLAEYENVGIISACVDTPYCEAEKMAWLRKYCPNIKDFNIVFCKVGENKAEIVDGLFDVSKPQQMVLIDDYSGNIYDWEMYQGYNKYVAIKFFNGKNNKSGKKYDRGFKTNLQLKKLLIELDELV